LHARATVEPQSADAVATSTTTTTADDDDDDNDDNLALSYGRIAKIATQFSHGLVNSAMGQIPCSTERISSFR